MADVLAGPFGFIGFGTVNSGIAIGLLSCDDAPSQIFVHDPCPERALKKAQDQYPAIKALESNQAVIDNAATVFVGLLPQHVEAVLTALKFRPETTVVSMTAMTTHAKLSKYVEPAGTLIRAVPIPPPWKRKSTILIYPGHDGAENFFSKLGKVIRASEEEQLTKLWALSGLMGPFYAFQEAAVDWAIANGVDGETAFMYTSSILQSCANDAAQKARESPGKSGAHALVAEQTPGGLNEQAVRELTDSGAYEQQKRSLDDLLARLEGREQPHKKPKL